ncbi:MAG: histone deacetylase family protein, partial [Burkholderiaceae bacterium]|nr:histone deacetylase family protein [Burkholderiaceae bacterium]
MQTGLFTHRDCSQHEMGSWHPECPERLAAISDHLISTGIAPHLKHFDAPLASTQALQRAHSADYVARLQSSVPSTGYRPLDLDTSMNPHSLNAALRAAGAVVDAADRVVSGEIANAFCAVRPPGHHARRSAAMGFCILNSIAVGARHALDALGIER